MAFALQVLIDGLSLGSFYALAALGIGLLFGVLKLINFAHGAFITFGAYALIVPSMDTTATLAIGALPVIPLIFLIVVLVVALALISEFAVFRPLRDASPATLMVGSFALGFVIQNLIIMVYGGRPKAVGLWSHLSAGVELMEGVQVPALQLIIIGVTLLLMIGLVLIVQLGLIAGQWVFADAAPQLRAAVAPMPQDVENTRALGRIVYTDYVLLFQLAGMILLVAMIGAIVLTLRHKEGIKRQDILAQIHRERHEAAELKDIKPGQGI